jgi:predicted acetyltransferase
MPEADIRSVGPEHAVRVRHLMDLAFDDPRPFDPDEPSFEEGRVVGAFDGDDLVGTVMTHEFIQVFGGRSVPCGGVAGVTVAPNARGRGLARRMLAESLRRMHARGEVISSLYPTVSSLYRSVGYGVAGEFAHRRVPFRSIGAAEPLDWAECEFGCEEMRSVQREEATQHDGWVLPNATWWAYQTWRRSGPPTDRVFSWLGRRSGQAVATIVYTYGKDDRTLYDLQVQLLSGVDLAAVRSSLAFLAGNASTAESLDTTVPGPILDVALDRPELAMSTSDWPWMTRLVDLEGATAARGFSPSIELSLDVHVTDPEIEANQGPWRLHLADGHGTAEPGGDGAIPVDIGDLARIYGGVDPRLVHDDGRLAGITDDQLAATAALFATRATLPIFF